MNKAWPEDDLAALPIGNLPQEECDVAVVGAGPAGLACAATARTGGLQVIVLDERPMASAPARGGTLVWGAFRNADGGGELALLRHGAASRLSFRVVVVATGAVARPPIMPGWTLPGVASVEPLPDLTADRRVLFAGNGPTLLHAAAARLRAGGAIAGIVLSAGQAAAQGLAVVAWLHRAGLAPVWRHAVRRIEGAHHCERAIVAPVGDDGRLLEGQDRILEVDAVCLAGNLAPTTELARLLGCVHDMRPDGAPVIRNDESGSTSIADVFVIGAATGLAGIAGARAQGSLAAAEILRRAGLPAPDIHLAQRRLRRARITQARVDRIFAAKPSPLPPPETIICRCESLSLQRLQAVARTEKVSDIATLKRLTRAGMGRCQGRDCVHHLPSILGLVPGSESELLAPQVPLRPIPLAAIAVEQAEWHGHARALLPPDTTPDGEQLPVIEAATVIVGAGIAGLSTAYFLAKAGHDVVVIDAGHANAGASGGNAGSLHVQLLSFDHGANAEGGGSLAAHTLPLQRDSVALWKALERETGGAFDIEVTGGVMVAETEAQLRFLDAKTAVERSQGIDCHVIGAVELQRLEPHVSPIFLGGAYCPDEGKINPLVATQGILNAARNAGARLFERTSLRRIERANAGFVLHTSRSPIRCGRVVNAAGAFAAGIGAMLGHDIPVFGAPLQMIVTEPGPKLVRGLLAHADRHLTLKQAANGAFLIGGGWTATLDPVHLRPRPLRTSLEGNLFIAQHVVPALRRLHVIRSWAAINVNIDGAPILGEHPREPGFFNAVTSNGYTLGPLVGQATAELILHDHTTHDISAFGVQRFGGG